MYRSIWGEGISKGLIFFFKMGMSLNYKFGDSLVKGINKTYWPEVIRNFWALIFRDLGDNSVVQGGWEFPMTEKALDS